MDRSNLLAGIGIVVLVLLVIVFGPLGGIWAVNTLFGTDIPFTLKTWAAALVLTGIVSADRTSRKST